MNPANLQPPPLLFKSPAPHSWMKFIGQSIIMVVFKATQVNVVLCELAVN